MYNSQLKTADAVKGIKLIIASLLLLFGWQFYTAHASTGIYQHTDAKITPPNVIIPNPEQILKKKIDQDYEKARYFSVVRTNDRIHYSKNDLYCLAKNIYHEAGNQPTKGKIAVAQVTINRTQDPKFAGTVCDVVMAHKQFSWTMNRHLRWSHPKNEMWDESLRIARDTLEHGYRVKGMEDALYYHANYVHPRWKHVTKLAQIGAHIFYEPV